MALTITDEGISTSTLTLTNDQIDHACLHIDSALSDHPEFHKNPTAFHMLAMAHSIGHVLSDGDEQTETGRDWVAENYVNSPPKGEVFEDSQLELHALLVVLTHSVFIHRGWTLPSDFQLRSTLLEMMVEIEDKSTEGAQS